MSSLSAPRQGAARRSAATSSAVQYSGSVPLRGEDWGHPAWCQPDPVPAAPSWRAGPGHRSCSICPTYESPQFP